MINLLRTTTQTTYNFEVTDDKQYLATLTFNDKSGRMISHHVSFRGDRIDGDKEDEIIDQILIAYTLPKNKTK
jgi:hypothetical protein